MSHTSENWPHDYYPGPTEHLHALGVISMNIGSFESNVDALYFHASRLSGIPLAALQYRYYRLDEVKRLREIRSHFLNHQKNVEMQKGVGNLLNYFEWARDCRNHLLHASLYPPSLGGKPGRVYFIKRINKASEELGYMNFSLDELRSIADRIRVGVIHCINFRFYIIYGGRSAGEIPAAYRPYVPQALPKRLRIPQTLTLTRHP